MKRIALFAVVISFISFGAFSASKQVKKTTAKTQAVSIAAPVAVPLAALFPADTSGSQSVAGSKGMIMTDAPNHEVMMVRIEADGTHTHACVNTEARARAFLSLPKSSTTPAAVAPQGK